MSCVGEPLKRNVHASKGVDVSTTAPIIYREFWDVPRIFIARHNGKQYLFDCKFEEITEDYPDVYQVYVLPNLGGTELDGSWEHLSERAQEHLEVLVKSVIFDESKRCAIDAFILETIGVSSN